MRAKCVCVHACVLDVVAVVVGVVDVVAIVGVVSRGNGVGVRVGVAVVGSGAALVVDVASAVVGVARVGGWVLITIPLIGRTRITTLITTLRMLVIRILTLILAMRGNTRKTY